VTASAHSGKKQSAPLVRDVWFDWFTQSWVVQIKDVEGNQIGDACFFATKQEAIKEASK